MLLSVQTSGSRMPGVYQRLYDIRVYYACTGVGRMRRRYDFSRRPEKSLNECSSTGFISFYANGSARSKTKYKVHVQAEYGIQQAAVLALWGRFQEQAHSGLGPLGPRSPRPKRNTEHLLPETLRCKVDRALVHVLGIHASRGACLLCGIGRVGLE